MRRGAPHPGGPSRRARHPGLWLPLLVLPLLGAGSCFRPLLTLRIPTHFGVAPLEIALAGPSGWVDYTVTLDGADVTPRFAPGGTGLRGSVALAAGPHELVVSRGFTSIPLLRVSGREQFEFEVPTLAPPVLSVEPGPASGPVPRSAWIRFHLAAPADASDLAGYGFGVECDGERVERSAHALADGTLILNPVGLLPAGASCRVVWRGAGEILRQTSFPVAPDAAGAPAVVHYDRTDPRALAPFPDDYWLVPDPAKPSGFRADVDVPPYAGLQLQAFEALRAVALEADGWSRQPPIVLSFSHPLDPSAVPPDEFAAQDPFAPIALVDVDPSSPDFGARVPYRLLLRSDRAPDGSSDHVALLFPTIDLRERGRYALVVTRRVFAAGTPGRLVGPSPFFARVLAPPEGDEPDEVTRARERVAPALEAVAALADVPIPAEDVALAVQLSIRTHPDVADLVHVKELALAAAPPELVIPDLGVDPCPDPKTFCVRLRPGERALEVRGHALLPDFRDPSLKFFARDSQTGLPVQTRTHEVPFVLTLPQAALDGPVPVVVYQHGNPGSPLELLSDLNEPMDDAGLALIGMQDTLNREIGEDVTKQVEVIFFFLVQTQHIPDYWNQTGADMISFLRAIQGLGALDLLHEGPNGAPAIGPDGQPELDPSTLLYKGISEGANNAQRFLPFAPELLAAEATVGGTRLAEILIHQSAATILAQIGALLPQLRPVELWVGLSLFQLGYDPQDGHTFLRHLYREPLLPFAGSSDSTPPSTLWTEGIGDTLVANNATRAMARELGIPHVRPVARALPTLEQVDPPVMENLGPGLTGGYFQYDPATTPGCLFEPEGHYCPQSAPEALEQRLYFLLTALEGAAEIVAPPGFLP
jgi:hypothetical protein